MREDTLLITCDGCGADITYHDSNYPAEWIIVLSPRTKPYPQPEGPRMTYAVIVHPPLEGRDHHFCNMACVRTWITRTGQA